MERKWRARSCKKEPWTVAWIEESMSGGGVLYDVGANVGTFSLVAAKVCARRGTVVAFEPGFASYAHLCGNIVLNRCEAIIIPVPLALAGTLRTGHVSDTCRSIRVRAGTTSSPGTRGMRTKPTRRTLPSARAVDDARFGDLDVLAAGADTTSRSTSMAARSTCLQGAAQTLATPTLRSHSDRD